jgi:hypothetical protein
MGNKFSCIATIIPNNPSDSLVPYNLSDGLLLNDKLVEISDDFNGKYAASPKSNADKLIKENANLSEQERMLLNKQHQLFNSNNIEKNQPHFVKVLEKHRQQKNTTEKSMFHNNNNNLENVKQHEKSEYKNETGSTSESNDLKELPLSVLADKKLSACGSSADLLNALWNANDENNVKDKTTTNNPSSSTSPPPPRVVEWLQMKDPESEKIYYHNKMTGVSVWEKPKGFDDAIALANLHQPNTYWIEIEDSKGRKYYYDLLSKETSWEKPLDLMQT